MDGSVWSLVAFLLVISPLMICASAAKIYVCGDSTAARGNGKIDGWGEHLAPFVTLPVVNNSIGGGSARSYTVEGRFQGVAELVQRGDTVIIEFGHNDGGSLSKDNGRTDCPGAGSQTCPSTFQGKKVVVQTFPTYLTNAGKLFVSKGAKVIFSSMTPNNIWEGGSGAYSPSRFTTYARDAAKAVGNGATFVDHGSFVAQVYKKLGAKTVNGYYPQDHTHTNAAGARVVAEAFTKAVTAAKDPLSTHVKGGGGNG
jgi:rhamnogalacturonan acetylesterase